MLTIQNTPSKISTKSIIYYLIYEITNFITFLSITDFIQLL
nr:MAG TPA: hypothetical protein [Caudoviricetes sp.]